MKVSDDILMAYVDGELDAERSTEVERAVATDASLSARLEQHRALRRRLKSEFDPIVDEPIPDRLAAFIVDTPSLNVTNLAVARAQKVAVEAKQGPNRSWVRVALPIAASVVFGVLIGFVSFKDNPGTTQIIASDGSIASDALLEALDKGLASKPELAKDVQIGLSYLAKSGEYCRSFSVASAHYLAGIACHATDTTSKAWRIRMLVAIPEEDNGAIRAAASSLPKEIIDVANAERDGDALDAEQEAQMVNQGWRR